MFIFPFFSFFIFYVIKRFNTDEIRVLTNMLILILLYLLVLLCLLVFNALKFMLSIDRYHDLVILWEKKKSVDGTLGNQRVQKEKIDLNDKYCLLCLMICNLWDKCILVGIRVGILQSHVAILDNESDRGQGRVSHQRCSAFKMVGLHSKHKSFTSYMKSSNELFYYSPDYEWKESTMTPKLIMKNGTSWRETQKP